MIHNNIAMPNLPISHSKIWVIIITMFSLKIFTYGQVFTLAVSLLYQFAVSLLYQLVFCGHTFPDH